MRIEIDHSLCIGDGICVDICPEAFEMGGDDLAHVTNEKPGPEIEKQVREAVEACPTSAISIHEE